MRSRNRARLLFALCLITAFFVLPALVYAMPAVEVTGTVTAAATGAKLEGVRVVAYVWDAMDEEWNSDSSVLTDASGAYSLGLDADTWLLRAIDETGTYDPGISAKMVLAVGDKKKVDFALAKDATAPTVDGYWVPEGYKNIYAAAVPIDYSGWETLAYRGSFFGGIMADDSRWVVDPSGQLQPWRFNGSGVATLAYSINGAAEVVKSTSEAVPPYGMTTTLQVKNEGLNAVTYYAIDKNGNRSKTASDLLLIDLTPASTGYTNEGKTIVLKPVDALTGVAATFYRIGTTGDFKSGTTIAMPTSGSLVVQFYSVDKVGNVEATKTLTVYAPASVSTPKLSTSSVSHSKSFSISGSVYGRSKAKGSIYVYKLSGGKYKYVSKKSFTEGSSGKFKVSLKLKKGTYKFKTHYGANTATSANMPVFSKFSAKIKVR